MIKKIIITASIIVALLILLIGVLPVPVNYVKFSNNKEKVLEYLDESYDFEVELIKTKVGKNAYPAGRQEDQFIFYDVTNDVYFEVLCNEDDIYDYYSEGYNGKLLADKIKREFSPEEYGYYIRCYGLMDSSFDAMNCQLFIIADNQNDLTDTYEMLSFMKSEFPYLNVQLIISPESEENKIASFLKYEDNISFDSIKTFYSKDFVLSEDLFSSSESFEELLQN